MSLLNRFKTAFSGVDRGADEPSGLVEDQAGVVYYIKPDGTRVEVGGGGGSLPDPITTDVTISPVASADPALLVEPTGDGGDVGAVVKIVGPANLHGGAGDGYYLDIVDDDGTEILNVDPGGALHVRPNTNEGSASPASLSLEALGGLHSTDIYGGGSGYDRINATEAGARLFRVGPLGEIATKASQPADNTLLAGEVAIWFDSSNGAAKVMFKGKTLDGTVVTGEVALT